MEGEPLLRPGTTYVLAAKTEQGRGTHQLVGGADFPVVDRQRWPEELRFLPVPRAMG